MLPRERFLRVPGEDPEKWAERYDLEPYTTGCYRCGVQLTTSIPFAVGELRGLIAPQCECGEENPPYCAVRAGGGDVLVAIQNLSDTEQV